jgi:hypothetical protein
VCEDVGGVAGAGMLFRVAVYGVNEHTSSARREAERTSVDVDEGHHHFAVTRALVDVLGSMLLEWTDSGLVDEQ